MNEIVQLTTQDVSTAVPVTTSIIIAEEFSKEHRNVVRDIESLADSLEKDVQGSEQIYFVEQSSYKDSYNRDQKMYRMNEPFFIMLVMGYTGTKALKMKDAFIRAFYRMHMELLARKETRHIGKAKRLSLTDSIRDHVSPEGNFKKFAYGNYTKLVYKVIAGKDVKAIKEERKIPEGANVRDYFTIEELDKIQALESKIAGFIEISDTEGKSDKEVYAMVKAYVDRMYK